MVNLIHRAAAVHLKERRKLILVPRETPLSLAQIENMRQATLSGAVILPAMPAFYHGVKLIGDLVDFVVARICDQLGIANALIEPWGEWRGTRGRTRDEARGEAHGNATTLFPLPPPLSPLPYAVRLLELIRFSHTLFALPFALLAAAMAWSANARAEPPEPFRWLDLLGILVCMAAARSAAMAFNRLADRRLDALNRAPACGTCRPAC